MAMAARHILCFGNDLHGDDGFGPYVYTLLCELSWPADVRLFNAGIAGLNALSCLDNCRQAILVDAVQNFGQAGEVLLLQAADLRAAPPALNSHGLGLAYLLQAWQSLQPQHLPPVEMIIVGVEIGTPQAFHYGLSAQTAQAAPQAVRLIRQLLTA